MKIAVSSSHLVVATIAVGATWAFGQGPLTPPGAPAPIMKTLAQVEPRTVVNASNTPGDAVNTFVISQPGSYYLAGNLLGAAGKNGISIQANDVTLDLNGFALTSGGSGPVRGINVPVAQSGFCVYNGRVRGWSDGGVRADLCVTQADKLSLSSNGLAGTSYLQAGLTVGNGSIVKDCVADANYVGFYCAQRVQISQCIATVNSSLGFQCENFVSLLDCTSSRNGGAGFQVGADCSVIRCNATRHITASGYGINTGVGCTIADCTAGDNATNGITASGGSTIRGCTASANGDTGIFGVDNCYVIGNTCDGNAIGIAMRDRNRIDGNSCTSNTTSGIQFGGTFNLVVRNSTRGNGQNYTGIGSGQGTMPLLTVNGPTASTPAWTNFAY